MSESPSLQAVNTAAGRPTGRTWCDVTARADGSLQPGFVPRASECARSCRHTGCRQPAGAVVGRTSAPARQPRTAASHKQPAATAKPARDRPHNAESARVVRRRNALGGRRYVRLAESRVWAASSRFVRSLTALDHATAPFLGRWLHLVRGKWATPWCTAGTRRWPSVSCDADVEQPRG